MGFLDTEEKENKKYCFETEEDGRLVKVIPENVYKVFAMMSLDPAYKNSMKADNGNSSAHWFGKLKICEESEREGIIMEIVTRLNAENSTRVSGDDKGIKKITENILNLDDLEGKLMRKEYSVIGKIIEGCDKVYFSFATKFCHYACMNLLDGDDRDNFPIWDNVMKKWLGEYIPWDAKKSKSPKEINGESESFERLTAYYESYVDALGKLAEKQGVSKTGAEQLIWYFHNGDGPESKKTKKAGT